MNNQISLEQLSDAMRLGKLGEQIVLKSKQAFDAIKFKKYVIASSEEYYIKRKQRNESANKHFRERQVIDDINGVFMRDVIREGIDNNDPRLQ